MTRLMVQACDACAHLQHPPRALCTGCGSTGSLGLREAAGTGVVDAVTVVMRSPGEGFDPPYAVARVRLTEGPILLTNVVADDPHSVAIDDEVVVAWRGDLAVFHIKETP